VKAAEARLARADAEYRSTKAAFEKQAMTEIDFVRATADLDTKRAELDQAKAAIDTKKADIQALQAQVKNQEENLRQAEYDLSRCTLHAPFSGEVSEIHIEAGGYARRGQAVAHLVMMNPIKVDLAVSAKTAAKLSRGDIVKLYVPGSDEPTPASVYEKATVADPETRTFRISVITRNIRQRTPFAADDPRAKLPIVEQTMPLLIAAQGDILAVEANRCLRSDDQGHYVWADPAKIFGESLPDGTVLKLRKFRVTPGERRVSFQGLYVMRELTDAGGLRPGTLLPLDPPDTDAEEQEVVIAKSQWLLQPGQLVPVLLEDTAPLHGIYVPMNTIEITGENRGEVFVVRDGKATRIAVEVLGQVRDLVRVRGEGLAAGAELIADYIHFLEDGEEVRVIRRRELNS
jgi:multidrug efflux pump subunit AcrA (membrane-fusion protein)